MKTKNPFKIMIASILIVIFFNFTAIGLVALVTGGMVYNGANYALMENGSNYDEAALAAYNSDYEELAKIEAKGVQDYLDAYFGSEKDATMPTSGLYAIWLTSGIARQIGEVFIMTLIEGIIIGFMVAFLFTKRPKGFDLLKGYLTIIVLSIILICLSGVLINSICCPYANVKEVGFFTLLPELDLVVVLIIMISICFLFLLLARSIIDNMNKKIARKKIFKDDDLDIF